MRAFPLQHRKLPCIPLTAVHVALRRLLDSTLEAVLEIEERAVKLRERHALEEIALTGGTTVFSDDPQPRLAGAPADAVSIGIAQFEQKMNFLDYYGAQGSRSRCTWIGCARVDGAKPG